MPAGQRTILPTRALDFLLRAFRGAATRQQTLTCGPLPSALLALPDTVIALASFGIAGRLRGPGRDGAAADGTDSAHAPASVVPVVWATLDVMTVTLTSGLRKAADPA